MKLSEFIATHYEVVHLSPDVSIEECTTFLLPEDHLDDEVRKINGLFISQFATPGSTLLVEAEDSLHVTSRPKFHRLELYIDTPNIETIMGWDIEHYLERIAAPNMAIDTALLICKREYPLTTSIDWHKEMHALFDAHVSQKGDGLQIEPEMIRVIKEAITTLAEELSLFDREEIAPLQEELLAIEQAMTKPDLDGEETIRISKRIIPLTFGLRIKKMEREVFMYKKRLQHNSLFPARTEAMTQTLEKVTGKAFLIAGVRHLIEDSSDDDPEHAALQSLAPLKAYLGCSPHVAILKPKILHY